MDWEKIKGIFIYLLIALNVVLFGANLLINESYKLTAAQERSIYKVMEDNGIGIYTDLIEKSAPMRSLGVSVASLDYLYFRDLVFEEAEEVKITLDFDKTVLASDSKSLIVEGNSIVYLNPGGTGEISGFNREKALVAANEFLAKIEGNQGKTTKLENVQVLDTEFIFEYNERYKGYKLFSNEKKITVTNEGVTMASASYFTVENFIGDKKSIISCDEALLTLVESVRKEGIRDKIYIEKIELGYDFQSYDDIADGSSIHLVPCYRIFTSSQKTYIINAYTNEMM